MTVAAVKDLSDPDLSPPPAIDESGRCSQTFLVEVVARLGSEERRAVASGRDIYAISAPLVVEATQRVVSGLARRAGVLAAGEAFDARGWWKVDKGDCEDIPLSARMKKWRNPARPPSITISPSFFIYGETAGLFGGLISKVWEGDASDPNDASVCIDKDRKFEYRQGLARQEECAGSNDERIRMSKVPRRGTGSDFTEFRWNFQGVRSKE